MPRLRYRSALTLTLAVLGGLSLLRPTAGQAAVLQAEAATTEVAVGQTVTVDLWLNAEDQPINTIAGRVVFPDRLLEATGVSDGDSVVSFWVDAPVVSAGAVAFSGAIPGGYAGREGRIIRLTLRGRAAGTATVSFDQLQALLNDGRGTAAAIRGTPLRLAVVSAIAVPATSTPSITATTTDDLPPEPFELLLGQDPETFGPVWFVAFATQDKGSGVDRYEVQERPSGTVDEGAWKLATSPYILRDQTLRSTIFVRATDRRGNSRLAVLGPAGAGGYTDWLFGGIMLGCVLLVGGMLLLVVFRRKNPYRNGLSP